MRFTVVTIFPELFQSFLSTSLFAKAIEAGLVEVGFVDPRTFTTDKHRTVDDSPYGGGEGMVLKPEPIVAAIEHAVGTSPPARRLLLSPQGRPLAQADLDHLAGVEHAVLVCGRYEGFDERIRGFVDDELSLGDFVLNGGEVPAMAIMDGVARLVPGVIGKAASLETESHRDGLLEYPQYTRPREFRGQRVPEVLLSGDHAQIESWRRRERLQRTRQRRPDLWARFEPTANDLAALADEEALSSDAVATRRRAYVALVHHPVYDRQGRVVTTALTNLDLHDIARSARTFGLHGYYLVTPIDSQQRLISQILGHWRDGDGANVNDKRSDALSLAKTVPDLQSAIDAIVALEGERPVVVATTATRAAGQVPYDDFWRTVPFDRPLLIVLGTGWGLVQEVVAGADLVLEPISGPTPYNHLSVRAAAAIVLDRLFSMRHEHQVVDERTP